MKNTPYSNTDTVLQHSLKKMHRTKSYEDIGRIIGFSLSTATKLTTGEQYASTSAKKIKVALQKYFGVDDVEELDALYQKEVCKKCGKEINQDWNICPFCGEYLKTPLERALEATARIGEAYKEFQQTFPGVLTNKFGKEYNKLLHALQDMKKVT